MAGHGLGPHTVGQRVVVRRLLPGRTGASGGPAMTDLLGVMESWDEERTTVRDRFGTLTEIPLADIVTGKPVPPRASPRLRVSAEEAEHRAAGSWSAAVVEPLGDWLLRASGGYSTRANSVLACGDPGLPFADAEARLRDFYARHGLPACAQVVVGGDEQQAFEAAGWTSARPGEADTVFEIASVAQASRRARTLLPDARPEGSVRAATWSGWLADDARTLEAGGEAVALLERPTTVGFAAVGDPVVAKGRVALCGPGAEDWAGISNVWVDPAHRRRGLALVIMDHLLTWAAERGATTAFLQVRGDNPPAMSLYERLGFLTHHEYRYLAPPR